MSFISSSFCYLPFFPSFDLSPKITHHTFSPPLFLPFSLLVIKPLDLISTPTRMCHTFHPLPRWRRWRTIWSWKYKYSEVCAEMMKVLNGDIVTAFFKSERGKMTLGSLFHKQTYRYKKIINWSWWIYFSSAWATFAVILLHLTKQAVWVSLPVALATAHAEFNDLGTNRVIACYYSSCLRQSKEGWEGEDGRNKPKKRWGLSGQPPEEGAVLRCATVSRHS